MKRYFITGAGTDIGKTFLTCALTAQWRARGMRVCALKPVASGFNPADADASDPGQLLRAQGMTQTDANLDVLSPWRFAAPLSPDMAAADEGRAVDVVQLNEFCRAPRECDYLLVEGVGGVMTPLAPGKTVLDWMAALGFPVILVGGTYLGSLSHTLTACAALAARGIELRAVFLSESPVQPVPPARTLAALRSFLPESVLLRPIARLDSSPDIWKDAPDLTSDFS